MLDSFAHLPDLRIDFAAAGRDRHRWTPGITGRVTAPPSPPARCGVEEEKTFPLAEAAEAHIHGEAGHTRGKLVLTATD